MEQGSERPAARGQDQDHHIETKGTGTTPAQAKPLNMANWFAGYTALTSFDGSGWDTSSCINYTNLFQGCTALARINISTWNTSGAPRPIARTCSTAAPRWNT